MPEEETNQVQEQNLESQTSQTSQEFQTNQTNENNEALEALQAELAQARERLAQARERLSTYEQQEQERRQAEMSELERAQAEAEQARQEAEAAREELRTTRISTAIHAEADAMSFHSPGDAERLLDMSGVVVGEDGQVKGVKEALKALAKASSYLIKSEKSGVPASPTGGKVSDATKELAKGRFAKTVRSWF